MICSGGITVNVAWDQAQPHHGTEHGSFLSLVQGARYYIQAEEAEQVVGRIDNPHHSSPDRDLVAQSHRLIPILAKPPETQLGIES